MENQIYNILNDMAEFLNVMQMKKLQKVLIYHLNEAKQVQEEISNEKYLEMFLTAKQIEGCSDRTIQYYHYGKYPPDYKSFPDAFFLMH